MQPLRFAGLTTGLLALFMFACAVRPVNVNKASEKRLRPANPWVKWARDERGSATGAGG